MTFCFRTSKNKNIFLSTP